MVDEAKLMQTIVRGADWQEVIATIVDEGDMDPANIDIIKLTDEFLAYLNQIRSFDFRIPARFILIAAVLLKMKCEFILDEEKEEKEKEKEEIPLLDISNIPELTPPAKRKVTRKVTLDELVTALNKAFDFKEKKEENVVQRRKPVQELIKAEDDIGVRMERIYRSIVGKSRNGQTLFSKLVPKWQRKEIVDTLMPLLHLDRDGQVDCEQEDLFGEIIVRLLEKK